MGPFHPAFKKIHNPHLMMMDPTKRLHNDRPQKEATLDKPHMRMQSCTWGEMLRCEILTLLRNGNMWSLSLMMWTSPPKLLGWIQGFHSLTSLFVLVKCFSMLSIYCNMYWLNCSFGVLSGAISAPFLVITTEQSFQCIGQGSKTALLWRIFLSSANYTCLNNYSVLNSELLSHALMPALTHM